MRSRGREAPDRLGFSGTARLQEGGDTAARGSPIAANARAIVKAAVPCARTRCAVAWRHGHCVASATSSEQHRARWHPRYDEQTPRDIWLGYILFSRRSPAGAGGHAGRCATAERNPDSAGSKRPNRRVVRGMKIYAPTPRREPTRRGQPPQLRHARCTEDLVARGDRIEWGTAASSDQTRRRGAPSAVIGAEIVTGCWIGAGRVRRYGGGRRSRDRLRGRRNSRKRLIEGMWIRYARRASARRPRSLQCSRKAGDGGSATKRRHARQSCGRRASLRRGRAENFECSRRGGTRLVASLSTRIGAAAGAISLMALLAAMAWSPKPCSCV